MKKIKRSVVLLLILLMILLTGSVSAGENEYYIIKEYSYRNNKKYELKNAFVEILIGSGDFVQYQDDKSITLSPNPDEIKEDEFGNKYAYYDLAGLKPGAKFTITLKRNFEAGTYTELIPTRTNTEYLESQAIYLMPQERVDSDDAEIISKAKELTEDIVSDYKKAQAIFEFINLNLEYVEDSAFANKGSKSALKNMKGVCEEFATLFVAMCRAVDIPSRVIEGYRMQYIEVDYSGEKVKEKKLDNHAWAEIYLQDFGWVPVEPTVIYTVGANRMVYIDAFCKMESPEYIANGVYNYKMPNRSMKGVEEISFVEKLVNVTSGDNQVVENKFEDIEEYDWAKDSIQFLYGINVVNGYSETEFGPQNNISRIEFISMLARALRYKETAYEPKGLVYYYLDYDQKHWSKEDYDYLMRCYQALTPSDIVSAGFYNIVEIFNEGKLDMNKPITRAEVVALMDVFLPENNTLPYLNDIWGNKFEKSIVKAFNYGLILGYPDKTFKPDNNITRAEIAVILERYIGNEIYNII